MACLSSPAHDSLEERLPFTHSLMVSSTSYSLSTHHMYVHTTCMHTSHAINLSENKRENVLKSQYNEIF